MQLKTSSERATRSHSQLNDYLHCSHAYYLKRRKHVPEAPSVWLAGGKSFHTATERFDLAVHDAASSINVMQRENDPTVDVEVWQNVFSDEFERQIRELRENDPDAVLRTAGRKTKDKPAGEDVDWWRDAGRGFVGRYIEWRASVEDTLVVATVAGRAGVEIEVTAPVGGVPMRGYVDRLMVDSDGRFLVVDLKTGSRTPVSPMQLALYSVQLEELFGIRVTWGAYYDARKGTLTDPIDLSLWTEQKLGRAYRALDRGIEAGIFLPRIDSHCKACGVRDACVFQGGIEPV